MPFVDELAEVGEGLGIEPSVRRKSAAEETGHKIPDVLRAELYIGERITIGVSWSCSSHALHNRRH